MKNIIGFLIPMILAGLAYVAKPSDRACIEKATEHYTGKNVVSSLINSMNGGQMFFKVEDCILWKTVQGPTGNTVAQCVFGYMFYTD